MAKKCVCVGALSELQKSSSVCRQAFIPSAHAWWPPSPARDLHGAARLMLLCQEIERACRLDGTQPGTAPEGPPCGALWVKSIVWPHWSLTGHIVALWDITHTKETGRIVSHSKWRSSLESKKNLSLGMSEVGLRMCVCFWASYTFEDTTAEKCLQKFFLEIVHH